MEELDQPPILDPKRHALFLDFDGSIVDFASRPEGIALRHGTISLLRDLNRRFDGALAIVTGRHIADIDRHLAPLLLPASGVHGREFRPRPGDLRDDPPSEEMGKARTRIASGIGGHERIRLEDKGSALVLHFRGHPEEGERARTIAEEAVSGLDTLHVLPGHAIFEILQRGITKGRALRRFMHRPPFANRIPVFVGDDATDEDGMRAAAAMGGFGVKIGPEETSAAYRLPDTAAVHEWLGRFARASREPELLRRKVVDKDTLVLGDSRMNRLFVVSNRVGPLADDRKAGGLAVGIADALRARGGVWFGWSGKTSEEGTFGPLQVKTEGDVQLATIDMTRADIEDFYSGYSNQSLWAIFHYRIDLAHFDRRFAETFWRINERFAGRLRPLLKPDDVVWVHDYHFIPLGERIRADGFAGPLGFFLHIPFPPPEILSALPEAERLVRSMLSYDVVGFQTRTDRSNFVRYLRNELGGRETGGNGIEVAGHRLRADVFPIGIDADRFASFAATAEGRRTSAQARTDLHRRKQIVGVDRLDYSKGIPERMRAFERLLNDYPEHRSKVNLLQVAPLSRSEVKAYAALRRELESLAGHINGTFGQLDWTPIQIMTRGFSRRGLAGLYRACDVALVTPLRDGMNLVAKEYVAAQDPENPGVLVLSQFAGSARELSEAVIVNPHDIAGMADALKQALEMPLEERKERWQALHKSVRKVSAHSWATDFLEALEGFRPGSGGGHSEHEAEVLPLRTASSERAPRLLNLR